MIRQILSVLVILAAANPLVLSGMLGARQAVNFVTLLAMAAFLLVNMAHPLLRADPPPAAAGNRQRTAGAVSGICRSQRDFAVRPLDAGN